jgi:exonuclease III
VISRKTAAWLNLSAININGRKKTSIKHPEHKWHALHRLMHDNKTGVLIVGETHLSAEQAVEIQESHLARRMDIYNFPFPDDPSTKGIAIVLNRELTNTEGVQIHYLIPGRAILAVLPWHGKHKITVLGVYAPAGSMEANKASWEELHNLWMTEDLPVPDWVGGDTNIVEEPIDRLPHRADAPGATAALAKFKRLLNLKDGWRAINPDTKAYTYISTRQEGTMSRIDRIYTTPELFARSRKWSIDDTTGKLTDHRMVSVQISAPGSPFIGDGIYTIPAFLMHDQKFLDFVIEIGQKAEQTTFEMRTNEENYQVLHKKLTMRYTHLGVSEPR